MAWIEEIAQAVRLRKKWNKMTNLEKVNKGLFACAYKNCRSCPYWGAADSGLSACKTLAADALALLREQEPVKPIDENYRNHTMGRCGHCKAPLPAIEGFRSKFCWMCGRAVKWDDDHAR